MEHINNQRVVLIAGMILLAAVSRILPHPDNFTPIGAMSLFGAAYVSRYGIGLILPIVSLFLSDLLINNTIHSEYNEGFIFTYPGWYIVYGATLVSGMLGIITLRKVNVLNTGMSALGSAILFYLITNFACWPGNPMYTQDFSGLMACYEAGLPFFGSSVAGNLFYSALLFGSYELLQRRFPKLRSIRG
jgi:hypothetical protein